MTCGPCGTHFCYVCGERTERSAHWNESKDEPEHCVGRRADGEPRFLATGVTGDTRCPANDDSEKRSFEEVSPTFQTRFK